MYKKIISIDDDGRRHADDSCFHSYDFGLCCNSHADLCQRDAARMEPGQYVRRDRQPTKRPGATRYVTQAFIQQIAAQGFKSIRIPITWMQHTGPASELYDRSGMDEPGSANCRLVAARGSVCHDQRSPRLVASG